MTPNSYLYFDYYQSLDKANEPEAIGGYLPLERVYSYEPMPKELTADEARHIIGVQANIWTEYMPTFKRAEELRRLHKSTRRLHSSLRPPGLQLRQASLQR